MGQPFATEKERKERIAAIVLAALAPIEGHTDGQDGALCVTDELIEAIDGIPTEST